MKKAIQPQVYNDCTVTCACGNSFVTMSTKKVLSIEICSNCHPFFTGQQRFVDTEGRIDKFAKKRKLAETKKQAEDVKKAAKKAKTSSRQTETAATNQSLKDMLQNAKSAK